MTKVYLCEKPSQGKTFAKGLGISGRGEGCITGNDTIVTWGIGHLIQQLEPKEYDEKYKQWQLDHLPIIPEKWKNKPNASVKAQYNAVTKILKNLTAQDIVYISTDADAEGEMIGVELLEHTNCKAKRMRIWNKSLDDISLKESLDNPLDAVDTHKLYLSALSRSRADWLIGMNLTIGISAVNRGKIDGFFSVGRVQTPTLNLIVQRDLLIENFQPKPYFELKGNFTVNGEKFEAKWKAPKEQCEEGKYFTDESAIKTIKTKVSGKDGSVAKFEKKLQKKNAPVGFSLSEITKAANQKYGYTAADVLSIMQSLYETHKVCSYPRTDCTYLATAMIPEIPDVITSILRTDPGNQSLTDIVAKCNLSKKSKIWNDKEVTAHHAIIPTRTAGDITALNPKEKNLYTLVRNRYIAQFLPEYEYYSSKIEVEVEQEIFEVSGNVPHIQGWREIEGATSEKSNELPILNKGDTAHCDSANVENKKTNPPARYNDATIIEDMKSIGKFIEDKQMRKLINENEGIGTEATRANILDTLIKRDFVKRDKKHIISTDKGRALISIAPELLKDPVKSAYWEQSINEISQGKQTYESFLAKQEKVLRRIIDEIKAGKCTLEKSVGYLYTCPKCNDGLKKIISKKSKKKFWVHSGSGDCKIMFTDTRGKPGDAIDSSPIDQGDVEYNCKKCQSKMIRRKGQFGFFWSCDDYKNCGSTPLPDDNGKPGEPKPKKPKQTSEHECPKCKKGRLVQRKSTRNGKENVFWGCNDFPKCKNIVSDDNGKPKLD